MKKTQLIYGTYSEQEWENICSVFHKYVVDYEEEIHVHSHRLKDNSVDVKTFRQLKSFVTKEEEINIRRERDELNKYFR